MTDAAEARWPGRVAALILGAWSLWTMARGLMWFDTGELALVAAQFGLGHPPGQPLYTLLAGLAARLPGIEPLTAMNGLSAICAGLCALPADALARRAAPELGPMSRCLLLLAVGVLVPLWDQASRIEVYAPATLATLILMAGGARAADEERFGAVTWLGLGLLAGLAACINPVFALAGALAAGLCALPGLVRAGVAPLLRAVGSAAAGGLLGLLPYAYVPWILGHGDRLIWGEWQTVDDVIGYLGGRDYAHTDHQAWGMIPENLGTWAGWLLEHAALPAVALGLIGWLTTGWLRRRAPLWIVPVLAGMAFSFGLAVFDPDVPDYQSYLAPALWMLPAGLAGLIGRLSPPRAFPAAAVLLMVGALAGARPLTERDRSHVDLPRILAEAWLAEVPLDGVLVVESDHLVFPLMYLQMVERRRADVVLINAGWAASRWYWDLLYRQHPDLSPIDLAARSTGERLRRLLLAESRRALRVESARLAGQVGIRPCPATWCFALGPSCGEDLALTVELEPTTQRWVALGALGLAAGMGVAAGGTGYFAWDARSEAEAIEDRVGAGLTATELSRYRDLEQRRDGLRDVTIGLGVAATGLLAAGLAAWFFDDPVAPPRPTRSRPAPDRTADELARVERPPTR